MHPCQAPMIEGYSSKSLPNTKEPLSCVSPASSSLAREVRRAKKKTEIQGFPVYKEASYYIPKKLLKINYRKKKEARHHIRRISLWAEI